MFGNKVISTLVSIVLAVGLMPLPAFATDVTATAAGSIAIQADDDIASGTSGTCSWVIDSTGKLTIRPTDGKGGMLEGTWSTNDVKWGSYKDKITSIVVEDGVETGSMCCYLFAGCENLVVADMAKLDVTKMMNAAHMFNDDSKLESLNVADWNMAGGESPYTGVVDMSSMFWNCSSLKNLDVSNWQTESATTMSNLFAGCSSLESLDLSKWDTSNVTSMAYMFWTCGALKSLKLTSFNTSKVTNMQRMFQGCRSLDKIDLASFDTSGIENMEGMFIGDKFSAIDLSKFATSSATTMSYMFGGCTGEATCDFSKLDTSKVTNMSMMFAGCPDATSIDLAGFDTSSTTDMLDMFSGCPALKTLDLASFNTSKVTSMTRMFEGCPSLESIFVSESWTTEKARRSYGMTSNCDALVGGNGTKASGLPDQVVYARIDREGEPGYLSYKGTDLAFASVSTAEPEYLYKGSPIMPEVIVRVGGKPLVLNTDFTVTYSNNTEVGTAAVLVKGRGVYTGETTVHFKIAAEPAAVALTRVYLFGESVTYDGFSHKPIANVQAESGYPGPPDYELKYYRGEEETSDFANAGTITVVATAVGEAYTGEVRASYTINPVLLSTGSDIVTLKEGSAAYDGAPHKPEVEYVSHGKRTLSPAGYSVSYWRGSSETSDFTNPGTIIVKVTGKDNYAGELTSVFTISEVKSTNASGITGGSGAATSGGTTSGGTTSGKTSKGTTAGNSTTTSNKTSASTKAAKKKTPKITVKAKSKTVKAKAVKKKAQSFKMGAKSSSGGKLSYKVIKSNKEITFKSGKVTLRKGAKKGSYSIKVRVTTKAKGSYKQGYKDFMLTFKVK